MENLIVIASCGRVRPLGYKDPGDDPVEQAHLTEETDALIEIEQKQMGSIVTDQSGRFGHDTPPDRKTGMSYGEGHNLKTELENQSIRDVAAAITNIVEKAGCPPWRLIFPRVQLPALLRMFPDTVRKALVGTEAGDWTKLPLAEVEKRLIPGRRGSRQLAR